MPHKVGAFRLDLSCWLEFFCPRMAFKWSHGRRQEAGFLSDLQTVVSSGRLRSYSLCLPSVICPHDWNARRQVRVQVILHVCPVCDGEPGIALTVHSDPARRTGRGEGCWMGEQLAARRHSRVISAGSFSSRSRRTGSAGEEKLSWDTKRVWLFPGNSRDVPLKSAVTQKN